jgi:glycosyltransferase involved in cell wall biosynthesis
VYVRLRQSGGATTADRSWSRSVKIAFVCETYSRRSGYLINSLPKRLVRLGHEVHVLTTTLPPYFSMPNYSAVYGDSALSDTARAGSTELIEGVSVHFLFHRKTAGYTRMKDVSGVLRMISPDVVQSVPAIGWIALQPAAVAFMRGIPFFSGSHTTASVFPLVRTPHLWRRPQHWLEIATRWLPGRLTSLTTEKCYAATTDCAEVATRFFGVQRGKISVLPLGVDTDVFFPAANTAAVQRRRDVREKLGFESADVVCVYSGRFSREKNPALLAEAIAHLRQRGLSVRGLFIGGGPQRMAIQEAATNVVLDFVTHNELGEYYRAADVGVWPAQESISMLDAAACGLPIVVNDTIQARERYEGNGLTYKLGDLDSLVGAIERLVDPQLRRELGSVGARKMTEFYSWEANALVRESDYSEAVSRRKR